MWMYLLCGIVAVLVGLIVLLLAVGVYSGWFQNIEISVGQPHVSNMTIAYKFGRGSFWTMELLVAQTHILAPKQRCICFYYDYFTKVQWDTNTLRCLTHYA